MADGAQVYSAPDSIDGHICNNCPICCSTLPLTPQWQATAPVETTTIVSYYPLVSGFQRETTSSNSLLPGNSAYEGFVSPDLTSNEWQSPLSPLHHGSGHERGGNSFEAAHQQYRSSALDPGSDSPTPNLQTSDHSSTPMAHYLSQLGLKQDHTVIGGQTPCNLVSGMSDNRYSQISSQRHAASIEGSRQSRSFLCPYCDLKFAATRDLNRHLWAKHAAEAAQLKVPTETESCSAPGCGYRGRRDNVARHIRLKHGGGQR